MGRALTAQALALVSLQAIVDFLIVAFAIFLLVRQFNRMQRPEPAPAPAQRDCPYCLMAIPLKARRCPHCTSEVAAA
jgi:large conductance mechanosensitive channel